LFSTQDQAHRAYARCKKDGLATLSMFARPPKSLMSAQKAEPIATNNDFGEHEDLYSFEQPHMIENARKARLLQFRLARRRFCPRSSEKRLDMRWE
jgi:hypothetical protein